MTCVPFIVFNVVCTQMTNTYVHTWHAKRPQAHTVFWSSLFVSPSLSPGPNSQPVPIQVVCLFNVVASTPSSLSSSIALVCAWQESVNAVYCTARVMYHGLPVSIGSFSFLWLQSYITYRLSGRQRASAGTMDRLSLLYSSGHVCQSTEHIWV